LDEFEFRDWNKSGYISIVVKVKNFDKWKHFIQVVEKFKQLSYDKNTYFLYSEADDLVNNFYNWE